MRRLALAALAFLLFFLPFQAGGLAQAPARACCPCMGDMGAPACPPACPAPSPSSVCAALAPALAAPAEAAEAAPQRAEEPLPLPAAQVRDLASGDGPPACRALAPGAPPPHREGQAFLSVFRI